MTGDLTVKLMLIEGTFSGLNDAQLNMGVSQPTLKIERVWRPNRAITGELNG